MKELMKELEQKAREIRQDFFKTARLVEATHVASCLSCIDIITALYFGGILKYDNKNPDWADRDRFVLSKGHVGFVLYHILCEAGFFSKKELNTYCKPGSIVGSQPSILIPGVESVSGSLGHGLSFAVGLALAARQKKETWLTYVVTGDGECQEGSIWEAAMSINQFKLNNLIWIIDYNKLQSYGEINKIMEIGPLEKKLDAFGFEVAAVNGHNLADLTNVFKIDRNSLPKKPLAIIANTIKGKYAPMLENKIDSHSKNLNEDDYKTIFRLWNIENIEENIK
jgi:transketolase